MTMTAAARRLGCVIACVASTLVVAARVESRAADACHTCRGTAGGMTQVIEAVHQIQGRAGARQLKRHDLAYVSGTGGVMSEQGALILRGGQ